MPLDDDDLPPLAPLEESPRVVDDRVAARKVVDLFGTEWSALHDEAPLPFVKPSFSLKEMFVGVTAVAVYLGLIRWLGPYAVVALQAVYALCCWFWKRAERTAFQHLAFDLTGGVVLPLSVFSLVQGGLVQSSIVLMVFHIMLLNMLLMATWISFGGLLGPWSFAFISGALFTGGAVTVMAGIVASVMSVFLAIFALAFDGDLVTFTALPLLSVPLAAGLIYIIHSSETYALAGDSAKTNIVRGFAILVVFLLLPVLLALSAELSKWWQTVLLDRPSWWRL